MSVSFFYVLCLMYLYERRHTLESEPTSFRPYGASTANVTHLCYQDSTGTVMCLDPLYLANDGALCKPFAAKGLEYLESRYSASQISSWRSSFNDFADTMNRKENEMSCVCDSACPEAEALDCDGYCEVSLSDCCLNRNIFKALKLYLSQNTLEAARSEVVGLKKSASTCDASLENLKNELHNCEREVSAFETSWL